MCKSRIGSQLVSVSTVNVFWLQLVFLIVLWYFTIQLSFQMAEFDKALCKILRMRLMVLLS